LRIGDGQLAATERPGQPPFATFAYGNMVAAFISRSPQPRWRTPDGAEQVVRVDVGRLQFLRGDKNWLVVILRDAQAPAVFRLGDGAVRTVVTEIHARSGIPVQRVAGRN